MKKYLLCCLMTLVGCATGLEPIAGSEKDNPLISASYSAADRLLNDAVRKELLSDNRRLLVASWVDVNQVSRSSTFGKMMAEQLASRLVQQGIPVVELKLRSNLFISERGGEMLLSREIKDIGRQHNADAVVVGTYADAGISGVYVTVKVVRASDGLVMSATNFMVERKLVSGIINQ
jgi:TolB-like protein